MEQKRVIDKEMRPHIQKLEKAQEVFVKNLDFEESLKRVGTLEDKVQTSEDDIDDIWADADALASRIAELEARQPKRKALKSKNSKNATESSPGLSSASSPRSRDRRARGGGNQATEDERQRRRS